jgi:hypothetical protein
MVHVMTIVYMKYIHIGSQIWPFFSLSLDLWPWINMKGQIKVKEFWMESTCGIYLYTVNFMRVNFQPYSTVIHLIKWWTCLGLKASCRVKAWLLDLVSPPYNYYYITTPLCTLSSYAIRIIPHPRVLVSAPSGFK